MIKPRLHDKIRRIPQKPGVYVLKDEQDRILYVGKAKNLRSRLGTHFRSGSDEDPKHRSLMAKVADFEAILTESEVEALILEANFVKEHRPRYNINLKDDKSFPYIRLTSEPFPRLLVTRKIIRDGSRYFGPYTDVGSMRQLLVAVRRIFPVRTCSLSITEDSIRYRKHKVCLWYHIRRCPGPCEGWISPEDYGRVVDHVTDFIQGKSDHVIEDLTQRMQIQASERRFEEAALLRDQIRSIGHFHSRQSVADAQFGDFDLLTLAVSEDDGCGLVFMVRHGRLINRRTFFLEGTDTSKPSEILSSLLKQYYLMADDVPSSILLPALPEDSEDIVQWLGQKRGSPVSLLVPGRGKSRRLLDMGMKNARMALDEILFQKKPETMTIAPSVKSLQKDLSLKRAPIRIEAFDVSDLAGQDAKASCVVFVNGKPKKGEYRQFTIRSVERIDDFRMIGEAVRRRMSRLLEEKKAFPDLILVDGGKGQLSATVAELNRLGIPDQPVIGLAKRLEEIYRPEIQDAQTLPRSSSSLRLLQRIRDEAHRFALRSHVRSRAKRSLQSELDSVPGIGPRRRDALIRHFGSLDVIRRSSVDELAKVQGMNRKAAAGIFDFFHPSTASAAPQDGPVSFSDSENGNHTL